MAFYDDLNNQYNIVTSFQKNPKYDFGIFARGYHQAANLLCNNLFTKNGFADYEGYPIIFLYRHAFELHLKNIIYWCIRLCEIKDIKHSFPDTLYNKHELPKLAEDAAKILQIVLTLDTTIKTLTTIIQTTAKEFNEIDPQSFSYRYPIGTKGDYPTEQNRIVNIESIYIHMDKLLNDLEVLNFGLDIETYQADELYKIANNYINN